MKKGGREEEEKKRGEKRREEEKREKRWLLRSRDEISFCGEKSLQYMLFFGNQITFGTRLCSLFSRLQVLAPRITSAARECIHSSSSSSHVKRAPDYHVTDESERRRGRKAREGAASLAKGRGSMLH